jgi:hypothetical protein
MTIIQKIYFPIWNKDTRWDTHFFFCWRNSLFVGMLTSLCRWSGEGDENFIVPVRTMDASIIMGGALALQSS